MPRVLARSHQPNPFTMLYKITLLCFLAASASAAPTTEPTAAGNGSTVPPNLRAHPRPAPMPAHPATHRHRAVEVDHKRQLSWWGSYGSWGKACSSKKLMATVKAKGTDFWAEVKGGLVESHEDGYQPNQVQWTVDSYPLERSRWARPATRKA